MTVITIIKTGGKWQLNGLTYSQLHGTKKKFFDEMIEAVNIEKLSLVRTPNSELKRHNHQFVS